MGELTIFLILAGSFAFAWYAPEFSDRELRFIDAQVFWYAVVAGVLIAGACWLLKAVRKRS